MVMTLYKHIIIYFMFSLVSVNGQVLTVGSKKFTENIILAETVTLLAHSYEIDTEHKRQLGGTRILWDALLSGQIDIYPEYTGTIISELLPSQQINNEEELKQILSDLDLFISEPLGFNNTYVLGMLKNRAIRLDIRSISDLHRYPDLQFGFSNEFISRQDGWQGLQSHYGLNHRNVRGLDHDLAYRAIENESIDVMDLYGTDAEIDYYDIYPLIDDKDFFPRYDAVLLYRKDSLENHPKITQIVAGLEGKFSNEIMVSLNAEVKINRRSETAVASEFLVSQLGINSDSMEETDSYSSLWANTKAHLFLVSISLFAAILVSIPLGIAAANYRRFGQVILGLTGIIQTIPALALLVFMIPLLGIGGKPAIVALFLYSLLPIVRNTYSGIQNIPKSILESAVVLGLSPIIRLLKIELPMALRSILAGIKVSAVINIGTATLGALIGAGGYGQPILTGIRLNDTSLILQGAVPAALLALLVQGIFELMERSLISKGLRYKQVN